MKYLTILLLTLVSSFVYADFVIPGEFQGKRAITDFKNCISEESDTITITTSRIQGTVTDCKFFSKIYS